MVLDAVLMIFKEQVVFLYPCLNFFPIRVAQALVSTIPFENIHWQLPTNYTTHQEACISHIVFV